MRKKSRKMDRKLVAMLQESEVQYIVKKYKVKRSDVWTATKKAGRSRAKVYEYLRSIGYVINTKK